MYVLCTHNHRIMNLLSFTSLVIIILHQNVLKFEILFNFPCYQHKNECTSNDKELILEALNHERRKRNVGIKILLLWPQNIIRN